MTTYSSFPHNLPELVPTLEFCATRGDLRRWLEETEHLLSDDTPVFVASDSEGNEIRTLSSIGVEPYWTEGSRVETVHPDDIDPHDPDDMALPVAVVLWP